MYNTFLKNFSILGLGLAAIAASVFLPFGLWKWSLGILVSAFWIFLNIFSLFQLVEMGFNGKSTPKDRVLLLSILKFPVLYLAGFFILKSRFFPMGSVLLGLGLFLAVFSISWFRINLNVKDLERSVS